MKASPQSVVSKNFESRPKLVDTLVGMVDRLHDESDDGALRSRLMGLSNQKLLRLYRVEQTVRERFGDRQKLINHIVDARKKAGVTADETFIKSLGKFSKARLLDLTKQKLGEKPAKQSPAERLASKHGKKERERALKKIKG